MVLGPMFGVAAVTFPFIAVLVRRFGKRVVMALGGSTLALLLFTLPLLHDLVPAMVVFAFCGFGVGIFLAVPNAILADVCEANARRTGERREAMFFGAQGFLQKISLGVSTGIFGATKDLFGSSVENPLGVQLSGPIAGAVILLAVLCFLRYPEQRINSENDP
jgi:glycoside/pentoside/hexuronide:cation symporter, GPH family